MQSDTQIKEAIKKAEEACEDAENKGGCANAWDDVEELSAAAAHQKDKVCSPGRPAARKSSSVSSKSHAAPGLHWHLVCFVAAV